MVLWVGRWYGTPHLWACDATWVMKGAATAAIKIEPR